MASGDQSNTATQGVQPPPQSLSLLDQIIVNGKIARDASQQSYARDLVGEFVNQVLERG